MLDLDKLTDAMVAHTVKAIGAATAPLLARIEALEGQLKAVADKPDGLTQEALTAQFEAVEARYKAYSDEAAERIMDAIPARAEPPELPDIPALVAEAVDVAVKALPVAKDGKDGAPGKDGMDGAKGEPGRDGLDVKGLFRADGGRLVAVMSDGTTKDLGEFVGKDGAPGKDGMDGLGFDDLSVAYDGERRFELIFTKGDDERSFAFDLPMMLDRGLFTDGKDYRQGDSVTYGGCVWLAQKDAPTGKPGLSEDWRLAVKKGRDGKSGAAGKDGKPGKKGDPGRDLTQLGGDGGKW